MRLSVGANALADYSVIISGPLHDDCPLFWTARVENDRSLVLFKFFDEQPHAAARS